ncbi:hypothetical protein GYB62_02750 [bacterium]|nr:hypothetical protein [bacterium]
MSVIHERNDTQNTETKQQITNDSKYDDKPFIHFYLLSSITGDFSSATHISK